MQERKAAFAHLRLVARKLVALRPDVAGAAAVAGHENVLRVVAERKRGG